MKNKMNLPNLRRMIAEEAKRQINLSEDVDYKQRADVFRSANDLLMDLQKFMTDANPNMTSAVEDLVKKLQDNLENMVRSPEEYSVSTKPNKEKKVKFTLKSEPMELLIPIRDNYKF